MSTPRNFGNVEKYAKNRGLRTFLEGARESMAIGGPGVPRRSGFYMERIN